MSYPRPHLSAVCLVFANLLLFHAGWTNPRALAQTPFDYDYFELRDGLATCDAHFKHHKQGRVAFLGGSITASSGWRELVCKELERRYPDTHFDFINAGIPSLGSTPGAFRLERDVLSKGQVDLLFAEAAVNDDTNGFSEIEQLRGMEGIVRQALLSNPKMNVVLLHFVDPGKMSEIRAGKTPVVIASHERVAEHYRLPSLNLAKEVTERIDAGEFTWEDDFRDLHPTPFGHALYAKSLARLFAAAWDTSDPSKTKTADAELPAPLDRFSYFQSQLISPLSIVEKHGAALGSDWEIEEKWQPTDQAGTRPGFVNVPALVAASPGATLSLKFEGVGVGVFVASGPDTGTLEFRMDKGDWQRCELFTQWSPGLHLPWAKMLAAELSPGTHQLELRVAEANDPRSQGHAVRIIYLLVNGIPTEQP